VIIIAFDATIKNYLKEIDSSPLLTWEQEKDLAGRIIESDDPQARETMVCSNLRLVVNIAKRFHSPAMTLGDLIEEGNLGLLRAVESFDPEHGVRFSTYASWWIKQAIRRAMLTNAQPIHIPTYMVELINHWRYTSSELRAGLGKDPDLKQMAEAMNLTMKKAKAVCDIVETVNAGFSPELAEDKTLADTLEDCHMEMPEDALGTEEDLEKAIRLLEEIEPREAKILSLRFGLNGQEPLTLKEIGVEMNLTRERIRQIQRDALARLNELMMQ
jgi:RNA polymerase sigma factor (sigma-70 family)